MLAAPVFQVEMSCSSIHPMKALIKMNRLFQSCWMLPQSSVMAAAAFIEAGFSPHSWKRRQKFSSVCGRACGRAQHPSRCTTLQQQLTLWDFCYVLPSDGKNTVRIHWPENWEDSKARKPVGFSQRFVVFWFCLYFDFCWGGGVLFFCW